MRAIASLIFILFSIILLKAQVGINTEAPKATLHVAATAANNATVPEGLAAPALTQDELISIDALYGSDQTGTIVYVSEVSAASSQKTSRIDQPGYYYFDGTLWQPLGPEPWYNLKNRYSATANTDSIYLKGKVVINGTNIAKVHNDNAALSVYGSDALINSITVGRGKGNGNASGNIAIGENALGSNTTGSYNIAVGYNTLSGNATGSYNIALGSQASPKISTGNNNISIGYMANSSIVTESNNIAIGSNSGFPSGNNNISIGYMAGGDLSGLYNDYNITIGASSRVYFGTSNIAIGNATKVNGNAVNYTIAIGDTTTTEGSYSIAIGKLAQAKGQNAIALGYGAINNTANSIVLGSSSVNRILATVSSITALSDRRIKKDIHDNVPGLVFINKLNPVTYNMNLSALATIQQTPDTIGINRKNDIEKVTHTGFIAQEVEKAAKEINYDFDGITIPQNEKDVYGVNYTSFVPSLIKALQEQKEQIDKQEAFIEEQKINIDKQDILVQTLKKRLEVLEQKAK